MKYLTLLAISLPAAITQAFAPASGTNTLHNRISRIGKESSSSSSSSSAIHMAYVPDGLTAAQYQKIKTAEREKNKGKNLGALGPRGFKSRSMQAWQEAYEKGLAQHEIAPFGYREAFKAGKLKKEEIPYMVRGGSWDNSDVKFSKKRKWLRTDKEYAKGGYKKEQSASILGSGPGFDWAGTRSRDVNLRNRVIPGLS